MPRPTQPARPSRLLLALCIVVTHANAVIAGSVELPDPIPPTPLEAALLADAGDGQFAHYTLIEAALVAGGVDRPDQLQTYRRKYETYRDEARIACRGQEPPRERARTILEFMHREILTGGYDPSASQMNRLFDGGKFNCVSATILFNALAADCGLTVHAVEMRTHAYSVVALGDQSLTIETTCPTWFNEPQSLRSPSVVGNNISGAREVSPAALVAVVYYNRGTAALSKENFAEAVSANLRALQLDPTSATARGNLLAAINNWALALSAEGKYSESIELLDQGRRLAPEHQPFLLNRRHVYRLWIDSLVAAGRSGEAVAVLAAARNGDQDCPL